tara:strand:- start:14731 stop:15315 length:585 start_codon:yes stop_codon:yes gene_type:complete
MPDAKLTDLPIVTAPLLSDKFYIVNNNLSKSVTLSAIAKNLPSILTTGNANVSGDVVLAASSKILLNNVDYSSYVYDQISTNFIPNTGTGLETVTDFTTVFSATSSIGQTTFALSAGGTIPRIFVKVPNQSNYPGFVVSFIQLGTTCIQLSAGGGVTIGSLNSSLSSAGQFAKVDLTYVGNQLYTLTGDLSATS